MNAQRDARLALLETEARYRRLHESMMDAYVLVDMQGRLIEWNRAYQEMLGYSAGELASLTYEDLTPECWHALEQRIVSEQVLPKGHSDVYEKEYRRSDGSVFPVELRTFLLRDDGDSPVGMWAIVRDISERKRVEAARSVLLKILEASLNEIYLFDRDSLRFRYVNSAACQNLGYPASELRTLTPLDIKPAFSPESFRALLAPLLDGTTRLTVFETVHRRKNGTEYPVEVHLQPLESGEEAPLLAVIFDITERKRTQAALEYRLLEARVRLEVNQALSGKDSEEQVLDALGESARVFPDVFASVLVLESSHAERAAVVRRVRPFASGIAPMVSEGAPVSAAELAYVEAVAPDCPLIIADLDNVGWLSDAKRPPLVGRGTRSHATVPITVGAELLGCFLLEAATVDHFDDAKLSIYRALADEGAVALRAARLRESARASQQRLALMLEQSPLGVIEWNTSREVVTWNGAAGDILGLSREAALGRSAVEILGEHAALLSLETPSHGLVDHLRTDGDAVVCEWFCTPLVGANGDCVGAMSLVLDVTARRRAEDAREKLEAQLRHSQRLESVGRLAGGIAHDFNNMLTVILGYADALLESMSPTDEGRPELEEIRTAAERSRELTRQLLGFSRKQIIAPRPLDLNAALGATRRTLTRLIGEDVELVVNLAPELAWVHADPAQVDQILMNLALNARDAMPRGGTLTLETANVVLDEEYCQAHPDAKPGSFVKLSVGDDGAGMDRATLEHVFEPFFTTKEQGKGTGLGLATVYGIVRQNGGSVNVYSEPGQGSVFDIYLPALAPDAETAEARRPDLGPARRGVGTVLLVEDDGLVRGIVASMLQRLGYGVLLARSADEAVALARASGPTVDVLLTDVVMPGRSGPQLRDEIVRLCPTIKVVFMSGYTSDVIVHRGILDPEIQFLQKPFTQADLFAKVEAALGRT
ncbi:MAG: PAS domain S-box protein [Polyangiaceae bacterium]